MTISRSGIADVARDATSAVHIGFDVGGTKIFGVVTDHDGAVQRTLREPTPDGAAPLMAALADMTARLGSGSRPVSVGVGMAGLITLDGRVTVSPNLTDVDGADIGSGLSELLDMPVFLDNEVNCAARWEMSAGAARGVRNGVMVSLGTGIGGAFMLNGEVLRGSGGLAGEPGHMIVEAGGRQCACGRRGCWEMYASGSALDRMAVERLGDAFRGPEVTAAARQGDAAALGVLDEFAYWLALGISNLCILTDPEMVVIGGGLSEDWDLLARSTDEHVTALLIGRSAESHPRIVPSEAGELSAALGAALGGVQSHSAALGGVQSHSAALGGVQSHSAALGGASSRVT
ncbi:MAG: ROK family protein [Acidimicrobiales bacterium]|nr:ROK family protein [Acidimicrobiales bacterium]MYI27649.1 ROK family protein [Acidimicrobiales bacterium]